MYSKKQIISAIADLGRKLGRTPSLSAFVARSGISRRSVQRFFPKWNDAVRAVGLQPYTRNVKVEDRALLEDWGEAVRRNGRVPGPYTYSRNGKYNPSTLERRFGSWTALPEAFRAFAKAKREWADVLALIAQRQRANNNSASPLPPDTAPPDKTHHAWPPPLYAQAHPHLHLHLKDQPTYGDPTEFRWLRHEPMNEQGVVLLFGMLANQLGFIIETVQTGFPDCEAKRQIGPKRWQRVLIEFEFESRNFRDHGHPPTGCDIIVCWRHNWDTCPKHLEVLELSRVIKPLSICEA